MSYESGLASADETICFAHHPHVRDCLKELEETTYWLELLVDSATVSPRKMASLLQVTNELLAIFNTISKKSKARVKLHPS